MRLVADENIDSEVIEALRAHGHEVYAIAEQSPKITDDQVLGHAVSRKALLLTADKDFGELVYRVGRATSGVLLLRLFGVNPTAKAALTCTVIEAHSAELSGAFAVLDHRSLRIRNLE